MNDLHFVDIIPDLRDQLGISSLEYIDVAIKQSKYYGHWELAEWFEVVKERLTRAIKEEWYVENP
jgi:hypothetical protein